VIGEVSANEYATRLIGSHAYQLCVAYQLTLDFSSDCSLVIGTAMTASSSAGTWDGEPMRGGAIDALLPLLYQPVVSAEVGSDGAIKLAFEAGAIAVVPCADYEAWHLRVPPNGLAVCTPGGSIALW